ncbi:MAG TPA: HAD family hydrolase [Solirubrobacteraceae bacterium]|nr:HAD family hydrolase [Solirubrobacteraceae bacterium]
MAGWVTFDCYGTLADWLGGMRAALVPLVERDDADRLVAAYHELEAGVEAQRPAPLYRDVLAETLRRAAAREGVQLPPGGEHALSVAWDRMPIFEDVGPALGALREAGWRLGILSNCDDDLLAGTLRSLPARFDLTVTAEQVGSYKPSHGHWRRFAELTEGRRECWVHVAQSWFHDIAPAAELELPRIWVDRLDSGEDPAHATLRVPDLRGLPEAVGSAAASESAS